MRLTKNYLPPRASAGEDPLARVPFLVALVEPWYWAIKDKQTSKCHDTGLAYLPIGGEGHTRRRITGSKKLH